MFAVRTTFRTTMSEVTVEVFNVMTGQVVLATRDAGKGLRVATELNSGKDQIRIF